MPKSHWKKEYVGEPRVDENGNRFGYWDIFGEDVKGNRFYSIFDINPSKRIENGKLKVKNFELMLDPSVNAKYLGFEYYDAHFYPNSLLKLTFKRPEYGEKKEVDARVELKIEYPDGTIEEIKRSISLTVPEGSKEPGSIKNSFRYYKEYEKPTRFDYD